MANNAESLAVAEALQKLMIQTLENKCGLALTGKSEIAEREIIEYNSRMRIGGLEKFNGPCYAFGFNYYSSEEDQERDEAAGAIIFFVEEESVEKLLKSLDHRGFDEDDQKFVLDNLGEFFKSLALDFSQRLEDLGYKRLIVSDVTKAKNNISQGLSFPYDRYNYHEISLPIWKKKAMVVDITMTALSNLS